MNWKFWKRAKEENEKWLIGSDAPVVNASAFPVSPADGITIDRLSSILAAAEQGDCDELLALYGNIVSRDADFLAGGLQRKAPRVTRRLNAKAPAKKPSAQQIIQRDRVRAALKQIKNKTGAIAHLMDSHTGWPVTFGEKIIRQAPAGSGRYYEITELREVPFWRITSRADENGPAGTLKIKLLNPDGTLSGKTELPTPAKYITHRGHLNRSFPDCWGGPLRAVVFWWYFANWARQASARHLEKTNLPTWVAKYPKSDTAAKRELQRAFARAVNTSALIIPEDARLDAIDTLKKDSVQAFIDFMALCQRQILKIVAGQTSTVESQPQGLGSNQSTVQADALDTIGDFDGALLKETLEEQLYRAILELGYGTAADMPEVSWGEDEEAASVKADQLELLNRSGIEVDDAGFSVLSELFGLPLRRKSTGAPALGLSAFAAGDDLHLSLDALAAAAADDWTAAFGADCGGIAQALRTARAPSELRARLLAATQGFNPSHSTTLLRQTLAASALNGIPEP